MEKPNCLPLPAHFGTDAVHHGQDPDPVTGAVIPAISLSTTFKQNEPGVPLAGYEYSRSDNPTRKAFEEAVAKLEGGKKGFAFASGSACTATIINLLTSGDHLISVNDVYGGTNRYFNRVAKPAGIQSSFVDMSNLDNLRNAFQSNTKMVWIETPTNPTLRIIDIKAVAEITHSKNCILVVDNTFLSPYFQRPLSLGADIVVHSVTKYLNGHSDAVMGIAIANDDELINKIKFLQNAIGAVPSAMDCYLANRGLKTLHLRMRQHEKSALTIAHFLSNSKHVSEVIYPGLPSHPQHNIACKQQSGFGGMISFRIAGNLKNARAFFQHTKYFTLAESLGGVESLSEIPALMTHLGVSAAEKETLGISDTLIRLSVGVEETEDLVEDLKNALEKACSA